jgi:hypothetical protein
MFKEISGLTMGRTWMTYAGSAWGVLSRAGWWDGDVFDLAGASGLAFQFIIHEAACPSSVTVYDWGGAHFQAMDRVGVYTDGLAVVNQPGLNTQAELRDHAVTLLKEAVDEGRGAVVWAPTPLLEFGIVTGYDDAERVFSVLDCTGQEPDPLLYDNLGRAEVPMLYIQRFRARRVTDREKSVRDALAWGIGFWKSAHHDRRYGCGAAAYDNFIRTLKAGDFNPFGAGYCLHVYADAKRALAAFFKKAEAEGAVAGLGDAAVRFETVALLFSEMTAAVPFRGPKATTVDPDTIPQLIKNLKDCKRLESETMDELSGRLGIETP